MRVLDEGRPDHTICEIEDASAAIRPIKDAYWRMTLTALAIGMAIFIGSQFLQTPYWAGYLLAAAVAGGLLSTQAFRNLFVRVPGISYAELARVALK
jgi:hypothetical protein